MPFGEEFNTNYQQLSLAFCSWGGGGVGGFCFGFSPALFLVDNLSKAANNFQTT